MSFISLQEEKLAKRYLEWRYRKEELPLPPAPDLKRQAEKIVEDAHRIARDRGRNVMAIIKELARDIKK